MEPRSEAVYRCRFLTMKRYLRVYIKLIHLNAAALIVYPANFYNSLLASIGWGFFSLYSVILLTAQTKGAFGWSREEILLLNGVYGIIIGIFHTVFSRNFGRFSKVVHQGQLDSVLMKPIDSQYLLSFWEFGWVSISRVLMAIGYVIIVSRSLALQTKLIDVFLFAVVGVCGILLLYSIWYMVITFTIWFTRLSNLVDLMFNITGIARYPRSMFAQSAGFAFWFLFPLLLIINIPTKVYLRRIDLGEILLLISIAILFFFGSRIFWKFALRSYTSASS